MSDQPRESNLLVRLINPDSYIGESISVSYDTMYILVHDHFRRRVGGIPALALLVASYLIPDEDASVILLRVLGPAQLPDADVMLRVQAEVAQQISGQLNVRAEQYMDPDTAHLLSFHALECKILGTFRLRPPAEGEACELMFASDLANYFSNQGLKVYKPVGGALEQIVNTLAPTDSTDLRVQIGHVRYSGSSEPMEDVPVYLRPADLLTAKLMIQAVASLAYQPSPMIVGQLIFDVNGEYANDNVQDKGCIRNLWRRVPGSRPDGVETWGMLDHPNDSSRKKMLLNFYSNPNLQAGKEILNSMLAGDTTRYVRNFCQVAFAEPDPSDRSAMVRYKRRVLAYRTLLAKAGYSLPKSIQPLTQGLFGRPLLQAMSESQGRDAGAHIVAAGILAKPSPSWSELAIALQGLYDFISDRDAGYGKFEAEYMAGSTSGERWADEELLKILAMLHYANGARLVGRAQGQHTDSTYRDYADEIYESLTRGRVVIVDQSSGDPGVNKASAERIMWQLFRQQQALFAQGKVPPDILAYIEEAHNLLPAGSEDDLQNVWTRTAKEGAKYRIGLVYATQEVNSIQPNILRNTSNWLVAHLNNTDETRELRKYYDMADFERSILRCPEPGFIRLKTKSNAFVVPVQARRFEA
jgi:hypothetical protein